MAATLQIKRLSCTISFIALLSLLAPVAAAQGECGKGTEPLYLVCDPSLEEGTHQGFCDSLATSLRAEIGRIGYCLVYPVDPAILATDTEHVDNLVMHVSFHPSYEVGEQGAVLTALVPVAEFSSVDLEGSLSRPLVVLNYEPDDPVTFRAALVRKIVENMRTSYVSYLSIESTPPGVDVTTSIGLTAKTPVEWILPLRPIELEADKDGYLPVERRMDLSVPGSHTLILQMTKRRFYHSRLMVATTSAALLSGVSYGLCRHFYSRYQDLDAVDAQKRPQQFGDTYRKARDFEQAAAGLLGAAGLSLLLSFWF